MNSSMVWLGRASSTAHLFTRTRGLKGVWLLEAVNFLVHVVKRPHPWNRISQMVGYTLWFFNLSSLVACQLVAPGAPSPEWVARAAAGECTSTVCKRSGQLLPERALYTRNADSVVLALDHYCLWIGTPIGLRNRKFFILFVWYSALFCWMGCWHSLHAFHCDLPAHIPLPRMPEHWPLHIYDSPSEWVSLLPPTAAEWLPQCQRHLLLPKVGSLSDTCRILVSFHMRRLLHAFSLGRLSYMLLLMLSVWANFATAAYLSWLALEQLYHVLRNRTNVEPSNGQYDVGMLRNWMQIFGRRPLLWPLPLIGDGPTVDGYTWPLNPKLRTSALPTPVMACDVGDNTRLQRRRS